MHFVATLAHLLAPWKSAYSNSKVVSTAVTALHLVSLFIAGGLAVASDRATLRVGPDGVTRRRLLDELNTVHRPILIALAITIATGIALAAADVETFASSPAFAVKLLVVALLLANGAMLIRT